MRGFSIIGMCLLLALSLTACSSAVIDDATGQLHAYSFRPIDDIVESELSVTNFANDGSATLPIHTTIPVACTLVYGTTPQFGSLTLDQDMAGGTHSDHSPLLTGLEPETLYFFRMQGVDESGVIYLSQAMTFTTRVQEVTTTENLASPDMGAEVIAYSSAFGGAGVNDRWGASSAFDGNANSEWSSSGDGDEAWIEVQLARRAHIGRIEFQTRSMSDGSAIAHQFAVTSENGETYGPFELPDASQSYTFDVDFDAQTLRFRLTDTTGGNTGVGDIAVYGDLLGE